MKKTFLIICFFVSLTNLKAQELLEKQLAIENKIEKYISKSIENYSLSKNKINGLKKNLEKELKEHGALFNQNQYDKIINNTKRHELRQRYFELHPDDLLVFTDPTIYNREILQTCTDGGFETWPTATNPYIFRRGQLGSNPPNMNTTNSAFVPFTVGAGVNLFNNLATLVSPGPDPQVGAVQRVNTGQKAIKLNIGEPDNSSYDIITMSRSFVVNQDFFDFSYNVILNDPSLASGGIHQVNGKPIFLVRIYVNNNIVRTLSVATDPSDCQFSSATNGNNDGTLLYSGWRCGRLNTAALIGQMVTVEFVVGDCTGGRHFGTVYIDDICNNSCTAPTFGSIDLNPIQTINCISGNQTICGTFQTPFNSQYTSMLLEITQNGTVVGSVNAPSSINLINKTFCFTVPQSAFGANPTGDFEFKVLANFTRLCTVNAILDPIFDFSANDTGPDVSINTPILSSNSISNICPNAGVNLNTITANNQPPNTTLSWHTNTIANSSNLVTNSSSVLGGTYYAAFYSSSGNCYSRTSVAVTATINQCISDLSITKSLDNYVPIVGSTVIFNLTAQNFGPSAATGVVVTDIIPSGFTLVSATPSIGNWSVPNWSIGNLANGQTATINIAVTVNPLGSHRNTATIAGNQTDPYPKNNRAEAGAGIIYAASDNFLATTINGCLGGSTSSVLSNDWYNDVIINPAEVGMPSVSIINNGGLIGATINNNGIITVPPGSAFGNYTVTYGICRYWEPTICSQTTVTIKVGGLPMVASNDDFSLNPINTLTGGQTLSVLTNDTVNGLAANNSNVSVSFVSVTPSITPLPIIDNNGVVAIPPGTTIGTYILTYKIVDNSCSLNYTTATVTIVVNEQIIVTPQLVGGTRANRYVNSVDTQSNGKIIITGQFTTYNGVPREGVARLNTNLTLDNNFFLSNVNLGPQDMKVIKNTGPNYNKIIIVGSFNGFDLDLNANGIVRLNADCTGDPTFNSAYSGVNPGISGSGNQIRTLFVFPDGHPLAGKILIGGMFNYYNNQPANKLALLNADGSYDVGVFNTNINTIIDPLPLQATQGFNSTPQTIGIQSDGKIIVGGYFSWFNGKNKNNILRLNVDGSLDETFNPYTGTNPNILNTYPVNFPLNGGPLINKLIVQSDDRIIIGGLFTHFNNSPCNNIVRLTSNGLVDTSFNVGTGFNNNVTNPSTSTPGLVRDMFLEGTKIYVSGDFTAYQGVACDEIIRLNSNGYRDNNPPFSLSNGGTNGTVWCMKRQGDGKIIIGGKFTMYSAFSAQNVTRIFPSNPSFEAKANTVFYDSEPDASTIENDNIITLYPNPSNGLFYITSKDLSQNNLTITVYTFLGQKVFSQEILLNEENELNLSDLKKGTYFITFTSENKIITKTIIIK